MTTTQAKEILLTYRRGHSDENDPSVAEALRLAETDSELRAWFEAQQQFQHRARNELRSIQPPADLQASILTAIKSEPAKPKFGGVQILAMAASIAILLGASVWFFNGRSNEESYAAFRSRMVNFALRTYQMDIVTNNPAAVRSYLSEHGGPVNFQMPANLEKTPVQGGGRLSWQNHPVSMICYTLPQKETLFVFVIDQNSVHGKIPSDRAEIQSDKHLTTVSFTRQGHTFLMAANAPADTLLTLASGSPPAP